MIQPGVDLARARRPVFKQLIKDDPKAALENAVSMVARQKLPAEVVALLEKRVNQVGALWVKMGTPMPGEPLPSAPVMFREAEFESGKTYSAYVYGARALKTESVNGASLNGVALDGAFAVNETPSRTLEVGEVPPADKPAVAVCPVSGLVTEAENLEPGEPVSEATPGVETATQIVYFCDGAHTLNYNEALLLAEGGTGGAFGFTGILPAAPTPALGVVKVLAIPMTYADQNSIPATEATLYSTLRDVSEFYSKASYGKLTLIGTVCPAVKLPHNEAWYVNRDSSNGGDISGTSLEHLHSRDEARKLGFDTNEFDSIVVRHNGGPGSYGGLATVPGSTVWVRTDSAGTWAHEIGHSFSLLHANFWDTAGTSSIGNGANAEYGDSYDIMGSSGSFPAGHYNVQAKNQIKWLPREFLLPVSSSGLYRIYAFDQGLLDPSRRYAMTIVKDSQRTYWGEVRTLFDTNPWAKNGMLLGWRFPNGGGSNLQLIDATNGSPFAKEDAPISLGNTFSDTESGIHMTTVAANDSPRYMDVQVNFGTFPDNQPPVMTLASSVDVVPLNATVTFTATATDPDGDTLAYAWQHFGSSSIKIVSPNAPVITRQFTTAGTYVVTCIVSDMKGGTVTRNKLITVGSSSTWTISGRVTLLGVGLQDVVVTANGVNGVVTDADGYFVVPNLSANTYTLTPLLYGYSFGELFNNSITVGPNFSGANFEATQQSTVTISAPLPTAGELAPVTAGSFRLSRTGETSQPLVVNVNSALGSATKTTDYTFTPDYVTGTLGFSTFTIPADADYLDVTVTPVADALAEGPETVILQLGPGIGYVVEMPSVATVVIADDDTTLPKVSLSTVVADTTENSGTPMVLSVARTGTPTGPLTVYYAVGGTATSGSDYTPLTGSVTLADGAASAVVEISPVNDALSEKVETIVLTLSADATYLVDSTASSATATLYDDDTQTVTVTVTDATAQEVDLTQPGAVADTGTFVVTRSGDTTAPLAVYYAFAGVYSSGVLALHGVDFEAMPGFVVIPAGQTQASITILPRYDGIGEGPELVVLYLGGNSSNYVLSGSTTAMVTITDSPSDLPSVDVANIGSATEGGSTATFRITVRGGTGTGALAVSYGFTGTASAGDFSISGTGNTTSGTSITLNNGATVTKNVVVTAVDDALQEDVESLTLTLASSAGYQGYAQTQQATLWLKDNDFTNTVTVDTQVGTAGANSVAEGNILLPVKFYVARTGSTTSPLTLNFTLGGSATNGADYDAGITYATPASGVTTTLRDVWGTDTSNIWAVGDGGVILKWNGSVWATQTSGTTANLLRVWGADASNVWAVGSGGTIRKWDGSTWSAQTSGTTNILRSVHGSSASNVWAGGNSGTVLKWNGSAWTAQTFGLTNSVNAVWVVDASNVWAAASGGLIRFWNGTTWASQLTGTTVWNALWGTSSSNLWAVGSGGIAAQWNGTTWTAQQIKGGTSSLTSITGSDSLNMYISMATSQALNTAVGGTQWTPHLLPGTATYNGIWRAPSGQVWAVGSAGTIVSWNWDSGAALSGSVTIPAGALGADVNLRILDDTDFEGTEQIAFDFAPGSYSRSPGTVMYLTDNDTATATAGFPSPGSTGLESVTTVNIPVTLSPAQATPVTVEYAVSGTIQNTSSTSIVRGLPYWVRVVKSGNTITHFESNDGTIWTQRGSSFVATGLGNTSYLAGILAAAGSTTATSAVIDHFSISGLSDGGSAGAETRSIVGTATGATHSVSNGVYTFSTPGLGVGLSATSDNFCFVSSTITNSADCTVTARLVSMGTTSTSARVGVMLRASTAGGAVYAATVGTPAATSALYTLNRLTLNGASNAPSALSTPVLPQWFQLTRVGDVFTASNSKDGVNWAISSGGTAQTISVSPTVLVGLGVSAASDGLVAAGTFDNVSLNGSPVTAAGLEGRTIGFVNEQGSDSSSGGVWTLNGSGTNLNDEGHFAAANVTGDFTFVARVTSLTGGAAASQAGILMRQTRDSYSKTMVARWIKSPAVGQGQRIYSATSAFGSGVDFSLTPGVLTFAPGETVQYVPLTVVDDTVDEPDNQVTILLSNANGANVNLLSNYYSYTILDDDSPPSSPYVGFAAASSTVLESDGTVDLAVSLSSAPTSSVTVNYSVTGGTATGDGTDYTLAAGTLTFAAGETVQTIPLTIVDDAVIDANETIIITLASPVGLQLGSISAHTVTITDDDLPVVSITANDATASEAGLDPGQFTLSRTGSTAASLTVTLTRSGTATSGTDYTTISTTQTIPAGAASLLVNVTPLDDSTNEGTETVILTVTSGSGYSIGTPATATVSILDDDRSTVTLVASDPGASETPGNPGQFTFTRTAPTTGTLTVGLTIAGTATNGTDYTTLSSSFTFTAGQATRTVNILPIDDGLTEGDEVVTLSLNTGSYDIGDPSFASVTITDNDSPPTLFIDSPGAQGTLIANGNGVIVSATITDDGSPAAVTQTWAQISGPGTATIDTPTAAITGVTFSAPGTYILRITATDTQFTVSDQVTVVVGSALVAADWITQDLQPFSARRGQSIDYGGQYTVTGTGSGYASTTSDQAHVMMRQISGDGAVVARLTSLSSATALSGVSIRDAMLRGTRRAVLGLVPGSGLQFRTRTSVSSTDTLAASIAAPALPLWLKLERNATTGGITASYAADSSGAPGSWVQLGTTTAITMDAAAQYGLTTTSNSTASTATGLFDHVSLTPAQSGPALLSEDATVTPAAAGSGSESSGTYTIVGSSTGYYHGWQYYGDMVVTARLATFSSGAGSASGGIRVAESMEVGGQLHLGRLPTSAYNGYYWTSLAGGASGGVPSGIAAGNWIRFVRKGTSITAYRAPDASGSPGTWIQIGQPQTIIMATPVWVGFYVNNSSGVGMNTCTFSSLSIAPVNKAPVVDIASVATWPLSPVPLDGTITDDGQPTPASLSSLWSQRSGPGSVAFSAATLADTTATLGQAGSYVLRLAANDGGVQSFRDLTFTGYAKAFEAWQAQTWTATGGLSDPNAGQLFDPDFDGQANLLEYAFGTAPLAASASPLVFDAATVSTEKYLRISVPKNTAATDVTFIIEATSDLNNPSSWSSSGLVTEQDIATRLIVRDSQPMSSGPRRFMRVKVVRN